MINTVVFDIGNVLADFDWGEYIKELVPIDIYPIIKKAMFSEFWNETDRGVLTDEELIRGFTERAGGYESEIRLAYDEIGRSLCQFDYAIPWIKELRSRGLRVLYLSNYSYHSMRANPEVLSFTEYMDGGIFSCEVHITKPDAAIYEALFRKYSLTPSECVFIDDNPANITAARRLGMTAIRFENYADTHEQLEKLI